MKIKFLTGPKAGQIDHAPQSQEIQLLAKANILEIIPYKSANEMLSEEYAAASGSNSTDPNVVGVTWGVNDKGSSTFSVVTVVKRSGAETTYFSSPPADAPASIVARFKALTETDAGANAAEYEKAKNAEPAQKESERIGALKQLFAGK